MYKQYIKNMYMPYVVFLFYILTVIAIYNSFIFVIKHFSGHNVNMLFNAIIVVISIISTFAIGYITGLNDVEFNKNKNVKSMYSELSSCDYSIEMDFELFKSHFNAFPENYILPEKDSSLRIYYIEDEKYHYERLIYDTTDNILYCRKHSYRCGNDDVVNHTVIYIKEIKNHLKAIDMINKYEEDCELNKLMSKKKCNEIDYLNSIQSKINDLRKTANEEIKKAGEL